MMIRNTNNYSYGTEYYHIPSSLRTELKPISQRRRARTRLFLYRKHPFVMLSFFRDCTERPSRIFLKEKINFSLYYNSREFDSVVVTNNKYHWGASCIPTCGRKLLLGSARRRGGEFYAGRAGRIFVLLRDD